MIILPPIHFCIFYSVLQRLNFELVQILLKQIDPLIGILFRHRSDHKVTGSALKIWRLKFKVYSMLLVFKYYFANRILSVQFRPYFIAI